MPTVAQGQTVTLDATYQLGTGQLVDPTNPKVSIVDPFGATVVANADPTRHPSVGRFEYDYPVAAAAPLGSWTARWTGTINGTPVQGDEVFQVVAAGTVGFSATGSPAAPCEPWEPIWCGDLPAGSEAVTGTAVQGATEVLWGLSGRQFGLCEVTVRPCKEQCGEGWPAWSPYGWYGYPTPVLSAGKWYNVTCGGCGGPCSCTQVESVLLPGPVHSILAVVIDGESLPATGYRVDDWRRLVRQDGGRFPLCQDLSLPAGQPGTWTVTLRVGQQPPVLGQMAVGELAEQFVRACLPGVGCVFPRQVQEMVRLGVTLRLGDIAAYVEQGLTGLERVDYFLRTYNPYRLAEAASVWSPDFPPPTVTTWP
jgi:hypothetical protein